MRKWVETYCPYPFRMSCALVMVFTMHSAQVNFLQAQDLKEAIVRMQQGLQSSNRFHIVMNVNAFETATSSKPFYTLRAEMMKDSSNYLSQMGSNELLLNSKMLIVVDHDTRQISCNVNTPTALKQLKDPFTANLDSLLKLFGKSSYEGSKGEMVHYRILHNSKSIIRRTDMYFDSTSYLLRRVEYSYQGNQRVIVEFTVFDLNPQFKSDVFSERKYLIQSDGKWRASPGYSNYRVIDGMVK